ncbi:MAG: ImmA/IrrE family metallo-endopeptidase [Bellilinea sp.]
MIKDKQYILDSEIESKAYAMLGGFESQYGKVTKPPIPIDRIIESYLDIWIDWDDIKDTDEERILGFLNPNTKKICMNERHRNHFEEYIGTEAYTKAHEVGHWDLHVTKKNEAVQLPLLTSSDGITYLCRQQKLDKREIQAEKYAAYLLMPHHLLMNAIESVDLTKWRELYALKNSFGVTITAFTKRLRGLKLIYVRDDGMIFHSKEESLGIKSLF